MYSPNLKSVALPVPEIIGGTQRILAAPGYAHAPFSPTFYGLLFELALKMYSPNLNSVALPVPEIIEGTQKFFGRRSRSLFSEFFTGLYSDWPCKCTRQI